jgi:NAD(P)-dependent dehydrogenase (short-subunit alcohol dehydrogenase family)
MGLHLYCVTKAALNELTMMMAYYEKDNIKSYGICPAVFQTEMVNQIVKGDGCKALQITD